MTAGAHRDYDELSHAEKAAYNRAITHDHERRVVVHVETLEGSPRFKLTPYLLPGSGITIDAHSDVSHRILTLNFLDPKRKVAFEPHYPGQGNVHRQYRVQVTDSRRIEALSCWVDCDVHTGPIWTFKRDGAQVSITAHGVDRLCRGTVRVPRAWRKKAKKTDVIRAILGYAGVTDMRIPDLSARTGKKVTIGFAFRHHKKHVPEKGDVKAHDVTVTNRVPRTDHYLEPAEHLADSMNRHLYFTGSGTAVLRHHPERPILKIGRHLLADPSLTAPDVDVPNTWKVLGKKPKGHHHRVKAKVSLPAGDDLSAASLAFHDKPYTVEQRIENPHLSRTAECKAVGKRHRDRAMRARAELEVDLLPIPWLAELDMIVVPTTQGDATILLKQWTYPLTDDTTPMHVGSAAKPRHHQHHKHHHRRHVHSAGVG